MSKSLTLFDKFKLFRQYLKAQKNGVIVDCPFCKSTDISFTNQNEGRKCNRTVYVSRYFCNNCHSACENRQEWVKY